MILLSSYVVEEIFLLFSIHWGCIVSIVELMAQVSGTEITGAASFSTSGERPSMSGQEKFFDFIMASSTFFSVTVLSAKEVLFYSKFFSTPTNVCVPGGPVHQIEFWT
jgi:hypothetical protein